MSSKMMLTKRQLPKLMACMTNASIENLRNEKLFNLQCLDVRGIRRHRMAIYKCFILELKDAGYVESSKYLEDVIYDNEQLLKEDDIGIVVDLRKRQDYLELFCKGLQEAEVARDEGNTKKECLSFLKLALYFMEQEKGILWLADKLFLVAIAVSSQYSIDGGRQKACCKYHYAKFLVEKYADPDGAYDIFTEVRDCALGKTWLLYEPSDDNEHEINVDASDKQETVLAATAIALFRVLLSKSKAVRKEDPAKGERLARLAERRASDAGEDEKTAEAIIEIGLSQLLMNNLNNAQKSFDRALRLYEKCYKVEGICETKMHQAAVMQRLCEYETAAKLLTEMGTLALENNLRRQLGRALHLLGELHLRREKPELGTHHLSEAFLCFMGFRFQLIKPDIELNNKLSNNDEPESMDLGNIYDPDKKEVYLEEAEQSRLMAAISAGQELMNSYFNLLREAGTCTIAKIKIIEWKLSKVAWWVDRKCHNFVPCLCPKHNRTPLDAMWLKMNAKLTSSSAVESQWLSLGRQSTLQDIRLLRSSYRNVTTNGD